MSLPLSRNTSYAASTPIKSADLNDLQDCVVAGKRGVSYLNVPAIGGIYSSGWSIGGSGNRLTSTAAAVLYLPLQLYAGDRILSALVYRFGNGVADITAIDVYVVDDATGTQTSIGNISVTNPAASIVGSVIACTDTVLGVGETAFIRIDVNATGIGIYNSAVEFDHP